MTHPDITFNVEGGSSCEAECLHVCIDNSLVHRVPLSPGALKLGDQLLIYWTPVMINQLDLLVCSVVRHTVVDQHIESVPLGPHIDQEGDGVSNMDWPSDPVPIEAVPGSYLHEALWGREGEHHGVGCVGSVQPS